MKLDDFPRLADFLVRCLDEEALGGLKLRRNQAGTKFIAPWRGEEPLFGPNPAEIVVSAHDDAEAGFFRRAHRLHYGYPLYFHQDGHVSPLFFIQVDIQKSKHAYSWVLHPVLKSLGVNRLLLERTGLSFGEIDMLTMELEGDFGAFDARLRAAADALDIPDDLLDNAGVYPLPERTAGGKWARTPILFISDISGIKYRLRWELSQFVSKAKYRQPEIPDTALGNVLDPDLEQTPSPGQRRCRFEVSPLNEQQACAVDHALSEPLTVITGPPGTGKSQVVVNILANCIASGESVLLAGNNNKPLDEVCRRLADIMDGIGDFTFRLGSKDVLQQTRDDMSGKLGHLLASEGKSLAPDLWRQIEILAGERDGKRRELDALRYAQAAIESALKKQNQTASALPPWWVEELTTAETRPIDGNALRAVLSKLRRWTGEVPSGLFFTVLKFLFGAKLLERVEADLRAMFQALPEGIQHRVFPEIGPSSVESLTLAAMQLEQHARWMRMKARRREAEKQLRHMRSSEAIFSELQDVNQRRSATGRELLRAAWSDKLSERADSLKDAHERYFDYVDRWQSKEKKNKAFYDGFKNSSQSLLEGLPVWITTSISAGASIPLSAGLFDFVVIDEAGQSDLASILPLLFRAKRAVFVGDPKQLKHIPGITLKQEAYVSDQTDTSDLLVNFSPITRSAYDLAASAAVKRGSRELLLSQHYRCHPDIIGFSNMAFYAERLIARTRKSENTDGILSGLTWRHVDGKLHRTGKSAANGNEADSVVRLLGALHERLTQGNSSVGLVTPFRGQANLIEELLSREHWWPALSERTTIGTAHSFQGSECDVMIFSPVVTNAMPYHMVQFAAHSDELLNVAVTRARRALYVVGDKEHCRTAGGALAKLVEYTEQLEKTHHSRPTPRSAAETKFAAIMNKLGLQFREEVPLYRDENRAPYRLDFVYVSASGTQYNLEVDGGTHNENESFQHDLIRDKVSEAAGFTVVRFPAADILHNSHVVADRLERLA